MMRIEGVLYESEAYIVVFTVEAVAPTHCKGRLTDDATIPMPRLTNDYYQIFRKCDGQYLCLSGSWAEMFQKHVNDWRRETPSADEVEDILSRYAELAQLPYRHH